MKTDWLWDRNISEKRLKNILSKTGSPEYVKWAAILLSRINVPREVFGEYLDAAGFCRQWAKIKKRMRQDKWNDQRIEFWQAIYEKLVEKYKKEDKKFVLRKTLSTKIDNLCKAIGQRIRSARKTRGWTQKEFAKRLGISQQLISRIEKGQENLSVLTLKKINSLLGINTSI